jgi:hypothetical protein
MGDYEGTPSGWAWATHATVAEIDRWIAGDERRVVGIHQRSGGADPRLTVVTIANVGVDRIPGGWISPRPRDAFEAAAIVAGRRVTCIDAFEQGGQVLFTGAWVSNEGEHWRNWSLEIGVSAREMRALTSRSRAVTLATYMEGDERRYAAVSHLNIGPGARRWGWHEGATPLELAQRLYDEGGRLVSIDPFLDENLELRFAAVWVVSEPPHRAWWYSFGFSAEETGRLSGLYCSHLLEVRTLPREPDKYVHIRYGYPRDAYKESHPLVELDGTGTVASWAFGEANFAQLTNAKLRIRNVSGRRVTLDKTEGFASFSGFINPQASHTLFGHLSEVPSAWTPPPTEPGVAWDRGEDGLTHLLWRVRAVADDGRTQRTAIQFPAVRAGATPVPAIPASVPVDIGLWEDPLHVLPLWHEYAKRTTLQLGGTINNFSGGPIRVSGFHVTVITSGGHVVADRGLNLGFYEQFSNDPLRIPPESFGEIPPEGARFADAVDLSQVVVGPPYRVRLTFDYKMPNNWCGSVTREVQAVWHEPESAAAPVRGDFGWGNAMPHIPVGSHARFHEHYCWDIGGIKEVAPGTWSDLEGPPDRNESYFGYGKPVHAMFDGVVTAAKYGNAQENNGNKKDHNDKPSNYVGLRHEGTRLRSFSTYHHLRPQAPPGGLLPGAEVRAGDVIGYLGNSGSSSAPHLHLYLWAVRETDRPGPHVCHFPGLLKTIGTKAIPVDGIPGSGRYRSQ